MKKLSRKDLLFLGLMLFSLFFGAGNLIFPPFLGQSAGDKVWIALGAFLITAVGFPILGVIAVAKSGGLEKLARRVNPIFASVFTVLIYLSIGPCLGIPRAGSLPFEMVVSPYLPSDMSETIARLLFTLVFFSVAYWLSLSPTKLVDRMGKVLTPTLLTLIFVIVIGAFFKPLGSYGEATGAYVNSPFVTGFLEGYLTMDTIAALNFGIVIALAIKTKGVKVSTHDEEAFLNSQNGIRKMSQSIYNAFLSYKRQHTKGKTTGAEMDVLQAESDETQAVEGAVTDTPESDIGVLTQNGDKPSTSEPEEKKQEQPATDSRPVFKIQIQASTRQIPAGSSRFKNLSPIDFYKEGAYYKYTYGATTDYQEAIKIRNKVKEDFEGAFIVAFKNGQKMELSEAISEYKKN